MESRVSNLAAQFDEFKKSHDLILLQLRSLMAKGHDSISNSRQPFFKMASHISVVKSDEIVLKLQSFHNEKIQAREKVDEFLSQYRPKYKPKSPPCLRPTLKKFKRVRDYAKYHADGSAIFHSRSKFQESFGFFRSELARKNEQVFDLLDKQVANSVKSPPFPYFACKKDTARDLVSGFPISDLLEKKDELPSSLSVLELVASKLLGKLGDDSLLCDQTFDIASLTLGFHEFTRDKGGTNIQRLFHSKSATVLESDGKNGKSQVFILGIHVSNVEFKKAKLPGSRALYLFDKMSYSGYILDNKLGYLMSIRDKGGTNFLSSFESIDLLASCKDLGFCVDINRSMGYYCKGIRDKGGTISQRLFTSKSKNQDCVMGSDCSKVIKCEVSFDSSMIINGEDAGNLGLHQLEACMDKNRKHERKFTFSRFGNGCCVVCCVVLDRDYCKGIRDKNGGSKFRIYTVGGKSLDLHLFFVKVTSRGGLDKVIRDHKWKAVIVAFKFPTTITSVSFVLRKYYLSLLYHFEQAYYLHKEVFSTLVLKPVSEDLFNGSATVKESAEVQFGSSIMGTIDGKFDGGYVVTVNLGSDELKGVLYHAPTATYVSQSFLDMPTRRN